MNKVTKVRVKQDGAFGEEMPLGVDASNVMLEEGKDLETKLKEFISGSGEPLTITNGVIEDLNDKKYFKSGIYRHNAEWDVWNIPKNAPTKHYNFQPCVLIVLEQGSEAEEVAPSDYITQIFIDSSNIYWREVRSVNFEAANPNQIIYDNWKQIYPIETVVKATDKADALAKSKTDTSTIYYWTE